MLCVESPGPSLGSIFIPKTNLKADKVIKLAIKLF